MVNFRKWQIFEAESFFKINKNDTKNVRLLKFLRLEVSKIFVSRFAQPLLIFFLSHVLNAVSGVKVVGEGRNFPHIKFIFIREKTVTLSTF